MAFIEARVQNLFAAEQAGSFKVSDLDKLVTSLDEKAAKKQDARWKMEHANAYSLARDHRYGRRSRRWLQARALRGKLDEAYAQWCAFARENHVIVPDIEKLPDQDINTLAKKPYQEILTK